MSRATSHYVPKLDDDDVSRALAAIALQFSGQGATVLESYSRLDGYPLVSATLKVGHATWTWTRLSVEHNDPNSSAFDKLSFSWSQQARQLNDAVIARVIATLDLAFAPHLLPASNDSAPGCDLLPSQSAFA